MSTRAYTPMPRPVASPVVAGVTAPGLGALGVGSPGCRKRLIVSRWSGLTRRDLYVLLLYSLGVGALSIAARTCLFSMPA